MSQIRDADVPNEAMPSDVNDIEPGMDVTVTEGDLGERDFSKPKVRDVVRGAWGNVRKVVIEKGLLFRKELEIPVERVVDVEPAADTQRDAGNVIISMNEDEIEGLTVHGSETLSTEVAPPDDLLEELEEEVPTVEGLRRKEERKDSGSHHRKEQEEAPAVGAVEKRPTTSVQEKSSQSPRFSLHVLGPGFLAGMAGNDASAVTSYSVNGATNGYGQLWLLLLATPLYQAVQYACAKIGRVSQRGLADLLRQHYGRRVAVPASLLLVIANCALIAADLTAVGSGLQLITGLSWIWFVVPVALILWYLTVYQSFGVIKRIFLGMSLAFVAYLITGALSGAHWGVVLKDTFIPQISFDFAGISSAVALLGATVSPYTMFWQVQGEKEEDRPGTPKAQFAQASLDIGVGTLSGNLVAYFIIVCTSATLFAHHRQIQTAADAARALEPLAGPFATQLFAIGLIGAGVVAIPVLLASTSYALADTLGWPASLWKKPWQNEGFYLILTVALFFSLVVALLGFNPIQLMFWANVLQGTLSPALIVLIVLTGNNRSVMGQYRLNTVTTIALVVMALIMFAATALLFYGLLTGQAM